MSYLLFEATINAGIDLTRQTGYIGGVLGAAWLDWLDWLCVALKTVAARPTGAADLELRHRHDTQRSDTAAATTRPATD